MTLFTFARQSDLKTRFGVGVRGKDGNSRRDRYTMLSFLIYEIRHAIECTKTINTVIDMLLFTHTRSI